MEATDRDQVKIAKKVCRGSGTAERENGMVATLRREIKERRTEITYTAEAVKELEKQLQGSDAGRKHVEAALRGQIEDLNNKVIEKEQLETTLRGHIKELEKKIREEYSDKVSVEFKLRCKVRELLEELQETESDKKEAESTLRGQREYYERKLQERDAIREQVEVVLYGVINRLQKEIHERDHMSGVYRKLIRLHERIQKNAIMELVQNAHRDEIHGELNRLQEVFQEMDSAVTNLEGTVRHLRLINRATSNVRDAVINQIQERDRDARNTRYGVRFTCNVFGRRIFERNAVRLTTEGVLSLAAVTVAVGAAVAGWWFLS